jgi:hypothetical protein
MVGQRKERKGVSNAEGGEERIVFLLYSHRRGWDSCNLCVVPLGLPQCIPRTEYVVSIVALLRFPSTYPSMRGTRAVAWTRISHPDDVVFAPPCKGCSRTPQQTYCGGSR